MEASTSFRCFNDQPTRNISIPSLLAELKAIRSSKDLERGRELHSLAVDNGYVHNLKIGTALIDMYAKSGSLADACSVFHDMCVRDTVVWTALIHGHATQSRGETALHIFTCMLSQSCQPNSYTFVAALKACTSLASEEQATQVGGESVKLKALEKGMAIHSYASSFGTESLFLDNTLVDLYSKCGDLEGARRVFNRMNRRSVVSWTALIQGHAQHGEAQTAVDMFACMLAECASADRSSFLAALKACTALAVKETATQVDDGRFLKVASLEKGMAVHRQAARLRCDSDHAVANTLVSMYARCGSLSDAHRVFERILQPDIISWTSLMCGYAEFGEPEVALELFTRMKAETAVLPDGETFAVALQASGSIPLLEAGRTVHADVCRGGLESEPVLANALVDCYAKCGRMPHAQHLFDSNSWLDVVAWNMLVAGYSGQGHTKLVLELFHIMQLEEFRPDSVTLLTVLTSCSRGGLVEEGKRCFEDMMEKYGVTPDILHYHCVVDILGRGNQLELAHEVVRRMPFTATVITWITLLNGCRRWKNVSVARLAFESLLALNREVDAAYLLMSSIYGSLEMWSEKAEIEAMRNISHGTMKPNIK